MFYFILQIAYEKVIRPIDKINYNDVFATVRKSQSWPPHRLPRVTPTVLL